MARCIDLTGQKFGRLTVVARAKNTVDGKARWLCECDCGNQQKIVAIGKDLRSGNTKSCGCIQKETVSQTNKKHGMSHTRLHSAWLHMKDRCYNPHYPQYKDYGGRGITVCEEWLGEHGAEIFIKWAMENGYRENLSLDRINTNGNYEPLNCRWVTAEVQNSNKRSNIMLTFEGKEQTLKAWAKELNINYTTLIARYHGGWSVEKILTTPVRKRNKTNTP